MSSVLFESIKKDFKERSREVGKYFVFLKSLEQANIKIYLASKSKQTAKEIDSELLKTLKASAFLLLYNLVESTMRNAIEAIFDELKSKRISYDKIRPELKKIVFNNIKKRNYDEISLSIIDISYDIIGASFNRKGLFSGNLDGRKIQHTASKYGFSYSTDPKKTGNGKDLLIVKTNRNDLAHGIKSFAEVGRDRTADELLEIKKKVVSYLAQILKNIEQYLVGEEYLDPSP